VPLLGMIPLGSDVDLMEENGPEESWWICQVDLDGRHRCALGYCVAVEDESNAGSVRHECQNHQCLSAAVPMAGVALAVEDGEYAQCHRTVTDVVDQVCFAFRPLYTAEGIQFVVNRHFAQSSPRGLVLCSWSIADTREL
jgi:hypothetical protein